MLKEIGLRISHMCRLATEIIASEVNNRRRYLDDDKCSFDFKQTVLIIG